MISHEYRTPIKEKLRDLEIRYIHEGRVVFDNFADLNYVRSLFHFVEFECLLEINEQICPRFILEFYSQYRVSYSDEGQMFVEFVIPNQFFSYSLEEFAQILDIPCEDACVFTNRWRLDELAYGIPSDGPYQTNLPSIEDRYQKKHHQRVVIGQADNKNDTRDSKETHLKVGFYTKIRPKEAQELQRCRIASLAIRVTKINTTATRGHPMIAKNKWPRLEVKGERVQRSRSFSPGI
ncbi:hypothetical protein Tco_1171840 [Tanacetum coccineum]